MKKLELTNEEIEDAKNLWKIIEECIKGDKKEVCPPEILLIYNVLKLTSQKHKIRPWQITGSFNEIEIQKSLGNIITNTLFEYIYTRWGLTRKIENELFLLSINLNIQLEVN